MICMKHCYWEHGSRCLKQESWFQSVRRKNFSIPPSRWSGNMWRHSARSNDYEVGNEPLEFSFAEPFGGRGPDIGTFVDGWHFHVARDRCRAAAWDSHQSAAKAS